MSAAEQTPNENRFVRPMPQAVVAQARAADERHKAFLAEASQQVTPEGNAAEKPADKPAQQVTPEGNAADQTPQQVVSTDTPAEKPADKPADKTTDVSAEEWKSRYNAMKGRFNASESQLRQMGDEIAYLREQIANLQNRRPEPQSLITEEERRDFGDEFLNVVEKKATEATRHLKDEVEQLKAALEQTAQRAAMTDQQQMYAYLDTSITDWREINRNDEFLAWLEQVDIFSGQRRKDMLLNAHSQNSGPRVAAFFESFRKEAAALAPKAKASEQPAQRSPSVSLDQLAAPGRARSAAPERPADETPFISRAQIAKFYADKANGKYRGREQEVARFERDIAAASLEGRIT